MKLQLEIDDEVMEMVDLESEARRAKRKPISQIEWIQTTKEGKLLWDRIGNRREFMHETDEFINAMIRSAYIKGTGGQVTGRPNISQYRKEIIEEAIRQFFAPIAVPQQLRG